MNKNSYVLLILLAAVLAFGGCSYLSRMMHTGGTTFVVQIEPIDPGRTAEPEKVGKILQRMLDAIGIDGEVTVLSADRIGVKVFGQHDPENLRRFLFTTHRLELRAVRSAPNPSPAETYDSLEKARSFVMNDVEALPYDEFGSGDTKFVLVNKEPIVTGEHVRDAQADTYTGSDLDYQISFRLNEDGAKRLGEWTGRNINNYIAVVLDGKVQSVAYIRSQITDAGEINGRFTKESAEAIALSLRSGYLPVTFTVLDERQFE